MVEDKCLHTGNKMDEKIIVREDIMKPYAEMTKEELLALRQDLKAQYHEFQAKDLKLDMSRGKPCAEQLTFPWV